MNQFIRNAAVAGAAAILTASPAWADVYSAPKKPGIGRAILLDPLSFVKISDLSFGGFIIPDAGQDIVSIDAATGAVSVGSALTQLPQYVPERGHIMGAGTANQAVSVTASLPDKLFLNGNPASPTWIDVSLNLDQVPDGAGVYAYTVAADKTLDVFVGGDLTVSAGMSPGIYANEYVVTATYQ